MRLLICLLLFVTGVTSIALADDDDDSKSKRKPTVVFPRGFDNVDGNVTKVAQEREVRYVIIVSETKSVQGHPLLVTPKLEFTNVVKNSFVSKVEPIGAVNNAEYFHVQLVAPGEKFMKTPNYFTVCPTSYNFSKSAVTPPVPVSRLVCTPCHSASMNTRGITQAKAHGLSKHKGLTCVKCHTGMSSTSKL